MKRFRYNQEIEHELKNLGRVAGFRATALKTNDPECQEGQNLKKKKQA